MLFDNVPTIYVSSSDRAVIGALGAGIALGGEAGRPVTVHEDVFLL